MKNIEKLQKNISAGEICLIENPKNLRYFLEFNIDTGYLLVTEKSACFITDFRYIEVTENSLKNSGVEVILQSDIKEDIKKVTEKAGCKKLFVETEYQSISNLEFFKKITDEVSLENKLDKDIKALRIIKSDYEKEQTEKAQKITDDAFTYILSYIKEGITEKDLALEIESFMRKQGAEGVSFSLITVSGKNTSLPHGIPTDKKLQKGEFITMDIGCIVNGYCSDMTRTVCLGEPTDEMRKVYETVLEAQKRAIAKIKDGVDACEVDKAARDYIYNCGYEGCFGHSTGHGVGLDIHEEPRVSEPSKDILKSGMIITAEPGIYLKDKFGVRIEDMLMVTADGYYDFTKSDKNLIII